MPSILFKTIGETGCQQETRQESTVGGHFVGVEVGLAFSALPKSIPSDRSRAGMGKASRGK